MKALLILVLLLLSEPSFSQEFLNLGFEYEVQGSKIPKKWRISADGYQVELDSIQKSSYKKSLKIKSISPQDWQIGGVINSFPLELARGKIIEFVGKIKTDSLKQGYAALIVTMEKGTLDFDNAESSAVTGTQDWTMVSIKHQISANVIGIHFGATVRGTGTAWFDSFELWIDGKKFNDLAPRLNGPTPQELAWLKKYIYPIKTVDPYSPEKRDVKVLAKLIGNSQVVALGEATHGSSEVFKMKHRLIKYLVEKDNFSIFSIEAIMPGSYKIGEYVHTGKGDPVNLLGGLYFWTWYTQEVLHLIEWMKIANATKRVQFTGFDMQTYEGSIQELELAFQNQEGVRKFIRELRQELDFVNQQRKDSLQISALPQRHAETRSMLASLRTFITTSTFTTPTKDWLFQNVRIIEQSLNNNLVSRDKYMAENLLWIKSRNPESKIVLWAHNGHIKKSEFSMGKHLKDTLGNNYLAIGFAFHTGTYTANGSDGIRMYKAQESYPGTYEWFFNAIQEPIFVLDLRAARRDTSANGKWLLERMGFRTTGAVKMEEEFSATRLTDDFDLLIFINESSHTQLLDF